MIERLNPLFELSRARTLEFIREPEAIFWVFVFPVLLALGLGIAFRNRPAELLRVGVADGLGAAEVAARLDADPQLSARVLPPDVARNELRTGKLALVVIPGDSTIYLYDPARNESRLAQLTADAAIQSAAGHAPVRPVAERHLSEPGSRYIDFLIPGLLGMNLMGSGMWGIGFALVMTRRRRLLKRFLATPMRRSDFLLSFVLSRFSFLFAEIGSLVGFAWIVFDVRVHGSLLDLAVVATLGGLTFAGLGLLTASRARTVEGVSGIMNVVMFPMWVFSGVFFSYSRFPDAMQPFIQALPLTPLNDALRAVMIDGASLWSCLPDLAALAGWAVLSFWVALKVFRWR